MKSAFTFFLFLPVLLFAQKKPLDHTVYDSWQSTGERLISNNGKWVVYTVTPQQGDATLYIQPTEAMGIKREVPRGYNVVITEDSRFVVFRIKPLFSETREARIKKKKSEDLPKDSIGIIELGKEELVKVPGIRSYKTPAKSAGWLAFHKEKAPGSARTSTTPTQKTVDSLRQKVDSLTQLVVQLKNTKAGNGDNGDIDDEPSASDAAAEGSDLVLRNLLTGKEQTFKHISDYGFSKYGQKLVMRFMPSAKDSQRKAAVLVYNTRSGVLDTVMKGGNDFKNFAFTEDGSALAFVAERDTNAKALQKFYGLYLYRTGSDTAELLLDRMSKGMEVGMTVSEHGNITFSKTGNRLLFGLASIQPVIDTTLVDFELAKLDVWHYNDDYLQTQQLRNLQKDLKRSYLAVYDFGQRKLIPLGSPGLQTVLPTADGDGHLFVGITDTGRRVQAQWAGTTQKDVYAINPSTGERTLVKKNVVGDVYPSTGGRYILLYDSKVKNYFTWDGKSLKNITAKINVPLYDEENDVPNDPASYGMMAWHRDDSVVYLYDRYDVWKVDPGAVKAPQLLTQGRRSGHTFRFIRTDTTDKAITGGQPLYFRVFDRITKNSGIAVIQKSSDAPALITNFGGYVFTTFLKARDANAFVYSKENYGSPPDLYFTAADGQAMTGWNVGGLKAVQLSNLNPQQEQYIWGTSELYKWKALDGKQATGILYKPENFNPAKKYPMLIYFYEKLSDGLHNYIAPEPTRSRLNISFFVSRGYLVFAPDISYTKGHPGKDAYNYIVSGAQSLGRNSWVDGKNIGIQGQSWGGYQVMHLITATSLFKAAWAGAPVVNMFSAYGGIRWESGLNRQFQYEKTQSRIGATPWERPDLYMENSPFFHLKKVTTPVVIMANDADGAVPWYQGIEAFTALRRLGKKVWMLNYNGEAHNLLERRNKKDIQIREQQFFDWMLKGDKPARWLADGVPAVKKGKDWGLDL